MSNSFFDLFCMALKTLKLESLTTYGVVTLCVQIALCEYDIANLSWKPSVAVVSECQVNLYLLTGCNHLRWLCGKRPTNRSR